MSAPPHEDPRRVLARHGLAPKRSFSQNFLVSLEAIEKIAAAVPAAPGSTVVELGPGAGTLTTALLRRGLRVIGVERDRDMARVLREELAACDFELLEADAASLDYAPLAERLDGPLHVVGNLPYAITGAILREVVEQKQHLASAVFMVQREVSDRLVANAGDDAYGALSVFVGACMRAEPLFVVRAGSFHPPPKVDSAVVRFTPLVPPRAEETDAFRRVVKAGFAQRRKMLRSALRKLAPEETLAAAFASTGIAPTERAERLTVEDFAKLAVALSPDG